jgi:D-alanine transaminase
VPDVAFVNGWIGPLQQARISVLDRAFLFGDGAYEVIRAYHGRPFMLGAHVQRLQASLRGLELSLPVSVRRFTSLIDELLARSGYPEARIYVQVTRGSGRREHVFPKRVRPTLVVYVDRARAVPRRRREAGDHAITLPDARWAHCHLKSLQLLPNVLAREAARRRGATEAILVAPGGWVREGAASNVFIVRGGALQTHPLGPEILPGVSRAIVLDLARGAGIPVRERRFRAEALFRADEVLLSGTMLEIMPVVRIDGRRVGSGRPGPVAQRLAQDFRALKSAAAPSRRAAGRGLRG